VNPLSINPLRALGGAVLILVLGGAGGWTVNGWRLQAELAEERAARAQDEAAQAASAVATLTADAKVINRAATQLLAIQDKLGSKIDAIQKEMKNAKPLPPDCRPDDFRVRGLDAGIDAANAAAAGR
jgi:hypothetical protein